MARHITDLFTLRTRNMTDTEFVCRLFLVSKKTENLFGLCRLTFFRRSFLPPHTLVSVRYANEGGNDSIDLVFFIGFINLAVLSRICLKYSAGNILSA